MRTLKTALFVLLFAAASVFAQEAKEQQLPDFKLTFTGGDTKVVFVALQTITLQGKEAGAFMLIQDSFKPHLEKIVAGEIADDATYSITLPANVANALYVFVNRATVTATNAERFINFKKTIEAEAKRITDSLEKI